MMTSPFTPGRVDLDVVKLFCRELFTGYDWRQGGVMALRGIGEKGTDKDGKFRESKFIDPRNVFNFSQVDTHLTRWGENGIAAFMLPGIVADKAADDGHAGEDRIKAFTAICLDIDSGNVGEKLDHCRDWIGEPTMVVHSGGVTDMGHNKVHAYWCLTAPTERVKDIGRIRKILAAKAGGDQSFGRAAQVIRIPGSIYGKGGVCKAVQLVSHGGPRYDLADLIETVESMEWMEGCLPPMDLGSVMLPSGGMDFSAGAGVDINREATRQVLMHDVVHEGAVDGINRWEAFNSKAGRFIKMARDGLMTLDEAYEVARAVMEKFTKPEWKQERFDQEWRGLLAKDMRTHGEMVAHDPVTGELLVSPDGKLNTFDDLLSWAVHKRSSEHPAPERVLVDGFFMNGKKHLFAGDGAAGKTYLMMDLALKLAAATPGWPQYWLGQQVMPDAHGGTVILMMAEDDKDDLDRRWHNLDPDMSLRRAAGDRLIALPMIHLDGMPQLAGYDERTKAPGRSKRWDAILAVMRQVIENGGWISAVIIDTLNSALHGEENSAHIIGEFVNAVAPVCGDLGAALIITHHIGKGNSKDAPIRDIDDMKRAVRGSSALPNAMRVVAGMWAAHDWEKQLKGMGMPVERNTLLQLGILKSNSPAFKGVKYIHRGHGGVLYDVSDKVSNIHANQFELEAWLYFCIKEYARRYTLHFKRTVSTADGLTHDTNRALLHPLLQNMSRDPLRDLAGDMAARNRIIYVSIDNQGTKKDWMDVIEHAGPDVERRKREMAFTPEPIDWTSYYYDPVSKTIKAYAQATE
jgi:hypothetical protein